MLSTAERVERLDFDWVGIQDHPYQRRFVDTWALLAAIAVRTSRLRLFPDVANLPLRPPSVMAKAAASIDVLSGGRFELGLGAGAFWDAIDAYGGPRRRPAEALAALAEAIEVIRLIWSGERNLRFDGRYYRLHGAHSGPTPAHAIGIWLGAYGPLALQLTGSAANGWVPSTRGDIQQLADMSERLNDAAAQAGRDPAAIRRVLNVGGTITNSGSEGPLNGPPDRWVEDLTGLALTHGFDTFVLATEANEQLEIFAEQIIPRVKKRAAAERT